MPRRLLVCALLPCLLVACAVPGAPGGPPPLVGTEWRLEDLSGAGVVDRAQATLAFPEPGRVAGNGSCNRFFGSYTLINDRIAFGQMGSTRMACAGALAEQEGRYMAALQKAQRVQMQGSTLLVTVEGQDKPLRFSRIRP